MYMSTKEAAKKWGISERRVRLLCAQGRVDGAIQSSWAYLIPSRAPKPGDGRQLRHQRQEYLRLGTSGFDGLEQFKEMDGDALLARCVSHVDAFIVASFAVEGIGLTQEDLHQLTSFESVPSLSLADQLLALHLRSMILSMARSSSLGRTAVRLSEQYLGQLYTSLCLGLENLELTRRLDLGDELEVFIMQDEREFSAAHPLVRALFCYGEVMRIAPCTRYNALLASLVYCRLMVEAGWAPVLVDLERIDELKAALVMTKRRGNYLALTDLVSEAYREQMR
ncbi:MAG: hypothetical protein RBS49_05985 [Sphaerochaeta sp.]|jgi:hypothetical protein|nr:hypothetical protein [Sphaerochaeta sp.]